MTPDFLKKMAKHPKFYRKQAARLSKRALDIVTDFDDMVVMSAPHQVNSEVAQQFSEVRNSNSREGVTYSVGRVR